MVSRGIAWYHVYRVYRVYHVCHVYRVYRVYHVYHVYHVISRGIACMYYAGGALRARRLRPLVGAARVRSPLRSPYL